MLVITRKKQERVVVVVPPSDKPTRLEMVIVQTGDQTRIGWEAPRECAINRKEIQDAIDAEAARGRAS